MQSQLYPDLPKTLDDARQIYDFLDTVLVKSIRDITLMCDPQDVRLILRKAKPVWTTFELATYYEDFTNYQSDIQAKWNQEHCLNDDEEDWTWFKQKHESLGK